MQLIRSRLLATGAALIGSAALVACIPPSPEPTPAPTPSPVAQPQPEPERAPPTVVTPTYDNWMDAPQTPGDWSYVSEPAETLAVFGTSRGPDDVELIIRCDRATRMVGVARAADLTSPAQMLVRTETQDRTIVGTPVEAPAPLIVAELPARDSLLDAIAFSKGRFAIEIAGAPPIFAPAYPEITRVIEDCRG